VNAEAFWMAAGGFLLAFQPGAELKTPRWTGILRRCLFETVELFLHTVFLTALYGQAARLYPDVKIGECFPLYYALGAYALKILRQKEGVFLAASLILGLSFSGMDLSLKESAFRAARLASGTAIYALLLLCAQRRLVFSRQPASFEGLPQVFLLAAFLALALHSLEGLFGF